MDSFRKREKKGTCYPDHVVKTLKMRYNNNKNQLSKITSTTVPAIVGELRDKIEDCDDEICWLDSLEVADRQHYKKSFFAPNQPIAWKEKNTEWLTNFDILQVMQQYEEKDEAFVFLGPSYIDFDTRVQNKCVDADICTFSLTKYEKHKTKFGFVFNLDEHTESGSHWVALFIDVRDKFIYYFDSTGRKIPSQIHALVQRIVAEGRKSSLTFSVHDNYRKRHQYLFTECGMFCLYFLITMLDPLLPKKKKIALFKKTRISDQFAESLRNVYFNKRP